MDGRNMATISLLEEKGFFFSKVNQFPCFHARSSVRKTGKIYYVFF